MYLKKNILIKPIEDIRIHRGIKVSELIDLYSQMGGFTAKYLAEAVDIVEEMVKDSEVKVFLSFTANIVATGLRGLIAQVIRDRIIDVVITTGGTVDHDIARSLGGIYYEGDFQMDDLVLHDLGIHRLGCVLIPKEKYGELIESWSHEVLEELCNIKETWGVRELLWELGKRLHDRNSILHQCAINKVPIFSPGLVDSAFGMALMTFREKLRLKGKGTIVLDVLKDMKELADLVYSSKKIGGIVLGGGISKHHLIWWAQLKGGLDYAVYITTAVEWDGSLSGARTREALSWGKLKPRARHVTVYGDVTIILPILLSRIVKR
ncbi:MAG: deoxyhypusine synthase [Thermoprotei archaeon]|nr:MAG: deoxyhypusine synthase [Thermoprotei archaeon]